MNSSFAYLSLLLSFAAAEKKCTPPLSRSWKDSSDVFAFLENESLPYMLTGSPVRQWAALSKWDLNSVVTKIGPVPNVRRSIEPRFCFWTIDTFSAELAKNENFWYSGSRLRERTGPLAFKTFKWKRPHQLFTNPVPQDRLLRGLNRIRQNGTSAEHYVYTSVPGRLWTKLLPDVQPMSAWLGEAEQMNLWFSSDGVITTPHFDNYHNVVSISHASVLQN